MVDPYTGLFEPFCESHGKYPSFKIHLKGHIMAEPTDTPQQPGIKLNLPAMADAMGRDPEIVKKAQKFCRNEWYSIKLVLHAVLEIPEDEEIPPEIVTKAKETHFNAKYANMLKATLNTDPY